MFSFDFRRWFPVVLVGALVAAATPAYAQPATIRTCDAAGGVVAEVGVASTSLTGRPISALGHFVTGRQGEHSPPFVRVVDGQRRPDLVRPMAIEAPTLAVSLGMTEIEDYQYWGNGVTVSIGGAWSGSKLIIQDFGPDGRLVKTFDPVYAAADGTASTLLKSDAMFPAKGPHLIKVTSAQGYIGSAVLTVVGLQGNTATVRSNLTSLSQTDWYNRALVISAVGFVPKQLVTLYVFAPDATTTVAGSVIADSTGSVGFSLMASDVHSIAGTWTFTAQSQSGTSGLTRVLVTPGAPLVQRGSLKLGAASITTTKLASPGLRYSISGLAPFQAFALLLTTPRGIEVYLGNYRANGDGVFADSLSSTGSVNTGTYTFTVRPLNLRQAVSQRFVLTDDRGHADRNPSARSVQTRMTRLATMDPAAGITVIASSFRPGEIINIELRDALNRIVPLSTRSIATTTVGATGSTTFRVNPAQVPRPGLYSIRVFVEIAPQTEVRTPLTIVS